jgi:hypothetical protein
LSTIVITTPKIIRVIALSFCLSFFLSFFSFVSRCWPDGSTKEISGLRFCLLLVVEIVGLQQPIQVFCADQIVVQRRCELSENESSIETKQEVACPFSL